MPGQGFPVAFLLPFGGRAWYGGGVAVGDDAEQKIRLMDEVLASQVAAGEVVERPASVVKELVENSIDAGARCIRVEIRRGGISLLKVVDDGCGMSRADAAMCLRRHATSKLLDAAGLFDIRQLGFRGEALPSIASVAHIDITTRRAQDLEGTRVSCDGGEAEPPMSAGCAPGTEICVTNLFFNTPVRRKFLKSDDTEAGHVEHQVKLHALAFPNIRFVYTKEGQGVFDVPATHDLRRRIADFIGREPAARLMRMRPTEAPGVRVSGYLMPLSAANRNRRMQYIFLNGRPIDDPIVMRAVRDGFGGFPTGLHPGLFLYLEVDPALVDVNVHPAKREVRFRRPSEISLAVTDAVAATLAAHARGETDAEEPSPAPQAPPAANAPRTPFKLRPVLEPSQEELPLPAAPPPAARNTAADATTAAAPAPPEEPEPLPFRHIGSLQNTYAIFENSEGLVLLAPRAARERIIFERLLARDKHPLASQRLLVPEIIEMDARDMGMALEVKPQMEQAGFLVSLFGRNTLRVEAVPAFLPLRRVASFVQELLQLFTRGEVRLNRSRSPFEPFAMQLARQYAWQEDITPLMQNPLPLLAELLRCEIPYCTPNGKPTLLPFSMSEINRKFQAQ